LKNNNRGVITPTILIFATTFLMYLGSLAIATETNNLYGQHLREQIFHEYHVNQFIAEALTPDVPFSECTGIISGGRIGASGSFGYVGYCDPKTLGFAAIELVSYTSSSIKTYSIVYNYVTN